MRSKIFSNIGWLVGGRVVQSALSFVLSAITARMLGPEDFGVVGYVTAIVSFFASICVLGFNFIVTNEIVKNPDRTGEVVGTAIVLRTVISTVAIVLVQVVMYALHPEDSLIKVASFVASLTLFLQSFDVISYFFHTNLKSKTVVVVTVSAQILTSVYRMAILLSTAPITFFAAVDSVNYLSIALLLFIAYKKHVSPKLTFTWVTAKQLLGQSYHMVLSGLFIAVYAQSDRIMIGQMLGEAEVGYYTAALTLAGAWGFVLIAVIESVKPIIVEARKHDYELFTKRTTQLFFVILWMSIVMGMAMTIFGRLVVRIVYGSDYTETASALSIVTWYTGFSFLGTAKNVWLISEGKQRYETVFTAVGASANVLLNFLLIPIYGISGAAVATLVTQIVTNFVCPALFRDTRAISGMAVNAFFFRGISLKEEVLGLWTQVKGWLSKC